MQNLLIVLAADCFLVWTGGFAAVPSRYTDWYWDMGSGTSKKLTYTAWDVNKGEPNNHGGQEDAIALFYLTKLTNWNDVQRDISQITWYEGKNICFIC